MAQKKWPGASSASSPTIPDSASRDTPTRATPKPSTSPANLASRFPCSNRRDKRPLVDRAEANIMIVVTGATGHTGKPAAERLLAKGEQVRVIGRYREKLETFVRQGAEAFVGNSEDRE